MSPLSVRCRGDRGGVLVIVAALLASVFFVLSALIVDLGLARDNRRVAQSAADSAALSVATLKREGKSDSYIDGIVKASAQTIAQVSAADWAGCTDPGHLSSALAGEPCISYDNSAKIARVVMPTKQTLTLFAGAAGSTAPKISALAEATWDTAPLRCVICALGNVNVGNGSITLAGGALDISGNLSLNRIGSITVSGGSIGVAGSGLPPARGSLVPAGTPIGSFTDPLASIPLPAYPAGVAAAGSGACVPGVYTTIDGCTSFATTPVVPGFGAVYTIVGRSKPPGVPVPPSVGFWFTCQTSGLSRACRPGEAGGTFNAGGSGSATLSWIAFDRNNVATLDIGGVAQLVVLAGIYAPAATIGGTGSVALHGPAVVGDISLRGRGSVTDSFTGSGLQIDQQIMPHLVK